MGYHEEQPLKYITFNEEAGDRERYPGTIRCLTSRVESCGCLSGAYIREISPERYFVLAIGE